MTRNIRKIVSIICAVALLLSISVVSFTGSSSAILEENGDLTAQTWNEEVNLTFQGEAKYGIPVVRGATVTYDFEGKGFAAIKQAAGAGTSAYFGKDGTVGENVLSFGTSGDATAKGNLYLFETGKTYKVTFSWAYVAGTKLKTNMVPEIYAAADPTKSGADIVSKLSFTTKTGLVPNYIVNNETKADGYVLQTGETTEWQTVTLVFTVASDVTTGLHLGIRVGTHNTAGYDYVMGIDDVSIKVADDSVSYGVTKVTHDMETETTAMLKQNSSVTATFVDSGDADHGKVLATGSSNRLTFTDSNVFVSGKKYYITYDAKMSSGTSGVSWLIFGKGDSNTASQQNPRFILSNDSHGSTTSGDLLKAFTYYIDGEEVTASNFNVTDEWHTFTLVFDYTNAAFLEAASSTSSNGQMKSLSTAARYFWFGNSNMWLDNLEIIAIDPNANPGTAIVEKVVDGKSTYVATAAGSVYALDEPQNDDPDRGFAGWADEDGNIIENPGAFVPVKGDQKVTATWKAEFVKVTYVDGSNSETVRLAVDAPLKTLTTRPNNYLFFQGWEDANGEMYTKAPDENITLYAKYNGTYMTFNNVICGEGASSEMEIVADPDNANNNILKITDAENRPMLTITKGDYANAKPYELKTNTTYTYSYKYKSVGGAFDIRLVRGNSKVYNPGTTIRTEISGVPNVKTQVDSDGWVTVIGTFTTGDSHYLERVNWFYQNKLIFNACCDTGTLYVDNILIAEELSEGPEGTYSISFETNGPTVATIYGFPGETAEVPESIPNNGNDIFGGWYTDKRLSVPYTGTVFTNENITLYAKWESVEFFMDVEKYDNSKGGATRCIVDGDDTNHYLHWNSEYNPSQSASTRYSQSINHDGVYYTVTPGLEYVVTFKYKLINGSLSVGPVYNDSSLAWASGRVDGGGKITLSNVSDDWQTASFTFTADCAANANYLNFGVAGTGEAYFDDISIVCSANLNNLYGSTVFYLNANGGSLVDPISGDPTDEVGTLPTPTRAGYLFDAWYLDSECTTKFTAKTFGDENLTLYAGWILGKFTENFEEFPSALTATGFAGGYKLYNSDNFDDFNKSNVQSGSNSVFRDGTKTGNKAFTVCRDDTLAMTVGKQYTVTFYVKATNVTAKDGTISIINMPKYATGINTPTTTEVVKTVGELAVGEWQKVSYTFTATDAYLGISTTAGNDLYFDNFTVTLKGYTGTSTGDSSVSPMLIVMMVILAAGALTITGKKVFDK